VHHPTLRHTFLYSNKTWRDVIFRDELSRLAAEHRDRLTVIHTLTREEDPSRVGSSVRRGRIGETLLREAIPDPSACVAYVCGPGISHWDVVAAKAAGKKPEPRFLETVLDHLTAIGVSNDRIKRESYG